MAEGDGFLSRWSRRKAGAKAGVPIEEAVAPAAQAPAAAVETPLPALPTSTAPSTVAPPSSQPVPLPTLDDVAKLTRSSDFSPYVARDVDAAVRNAAMKKLFSDPHFNVMDGLDTYIDDYGKPDPIPLSMLRQMNQSAVLGLFDHEVDADAPQALPACKPAHASPDGADPAAVAESITPLPPLPPCPSDPRADDDPDLQLQPDDADRRAGAGPGARD